MMSLAGQGELRGFFRLSGKEKPRRLRLPGLKTRAYLRRLSRAPTKIPTAATVPSVQSGFSRTKVVAQLAMSQAA